MFPYILSPMPVVNISGMSAHARHISRLTASLQVERMTLTAVSKQRGQNGVTPNDECQQVTST